MFSGHWNFSATLVSRAVGRQGIALLPRLLACGQALPWEGRVASGDADPLEREAEWIGFFFFPWGKSSLKNADFQMAWCGGVGLADVVANGLRGVRGEW